MTQAMGKGGLVLAIVSAVAMSAVAYFLGDPSPLTGDCGLCFPSPNQWLASPLHSWILNISLLLLCAGALGLFDHRYSVVPGDATILPGIFLLMATSIPWVGGMFSSAAIMAPVVLICLAMLCDQFDSRNATQPMFVVATLLSLGSMVQYAFVFMTVPVLIVAIMFKCFRVKEFLAFLLGLVAPYWIVFGFGLVNPLEIRIPAFTNLFSGFIPGDVLFIGLINLGCTALTAVVLALYNSIKLYAGNSRRRKMNMAVNIFGICCICCMLFDSGNLTAYTVTFYMAAAFQWADLFALWNFRKPWIGALLLCAAYIGLFVMAIL